MTKEFLMNTDIKNIALFTIAVGKDPVYFQSVHRYLPYNRENFGQDKDVDYFLFIVYQIYMNYDKDR